MTQLKAENIKLLYNKLIEELDDEKVIETFYQLFRYAYEKKFKHSVNFYDKLIPSLRSSNWNFFKDLNLDLDINSNLIKYDIKYWSFEKFNILHNVLQNQKIDLIDIFQNSILNNGKEKEIIHEINRNFKYFSTIKSKEYDVSIPHRKETLNKVMTVLLKNKIELENEITCRHLLIGMQIGIMYGWQIEVTKWFSEFIETNKKLNAVHVSALEKIKKSLSKEDLKSLLSENNFYELFNTENSLKEEEFVAITYKLDLLKISNENKIHFIIIDKNILNCLKILPTLLKEKMNVYEASYNISTSTICKLNIILSDENKKNVKEVINILFNQVFFTKEEIDYSALEKLVLEIIEKVNFKNKLSSQLILKEKNTQSQIKI